MCLHLFMSEFSGFLLLFMSGSTNPAVMLLLGKRSKSGKEDAGTKGSREVASLFLVMVVCIFSYTVCHTNTKF